MTTQNDRHDWLCKHFSIPEFVDEEEPKTISEIFKPQRGKQRKQLTPFAKCRRPEFKRGREAYQQGKRRSSNPYDAETLAYELYDDGWESAKTGKLPRWETRFFADGTRRDSNENLGATK